MRRTRTNRRSLVWLTAALLLGGTSLARAQDSGAQPQPESKPTFEMYGFAMLDIGHNFDQINPNCHDEQHRTPLRRRRR